jgi:hypothetical protein
MLGLNGELGSDEAIAACNLVRDHEYARERATRKERQEESVLMESYRRRRRALIYTNNQLPSIVITAPCVVVLNAKEFAFC